MKNNKVKKTNKQAEKTTALDKGKQDITWNKTKSNPNKATKNSDHVTEKIMIILFVEQQGHYKWKTRKHSPPKDRTAGVYCCKMKTLNLRQMMTLRQEVIWIMALRTACLFVDREISSMSFSIKIMRIIWYKQQRGASYYSVVSHVVM